MPLLIGIVVSSGKATLHELQTVYGLEDVHNFLEILAVDAHNERMMVRRAQNG